MDDTERDKLESGVEDGRERGDDIDLLSLGKSPAHFCISRKLAGRMFSRPECMRPLALGRSWSLALEPDAMVGGGLCDHEVTRTRRAPEDDQNSVCNVAGGTAATAELRWRWATVTERAKGELGSGPLSREIAGLRKKNRGMIRMRERV
jgi:hypothetical protein